MQHAVRDWHVPERSFRGAMLAKPASNMSQDEVTQEGQLSLAAPKLARGRGGGGTGPYVDLAVSHTDRRIAKDERHGQKGGFYGWATRREACDKERAADVAVVGSCRCHRSRALLPLQLLLLCLVVSSSGDDV